MYTSNDIRISQTYKWGQNCTDHVQPEVSYELQGHSRIPFAVVKHGLDKPVELFNVHLRGGVGVRAAIPRSAFNASVLVPQ